MKYLPHVLLCLATLTTSSLFGQDATAKTETHVDMAARTNPTPPAQPHLTKFDLDFPGGTPGELVATIQKAMGRPLNAIVSTEYASRKLPPLKMSGVDVPHLFMALTLASRHTGWSSTDGNNVIQQQVEYGFRTLENDPRAQSDDTIWSFYEQGSRAQPSVSRFYFLAPYLDGGLTVDDITTAIQTGWRLQGNVVPPKLNFHKETKLLIAVGSPAELETIESVLKALDPMKAKPPTDKSTTEAKTKP